MQTDQRTQTHYPAAQPEGGLIDRASALLGGFRLTDILTAAQHSQDFRETRADYIGKRLRFMLLFFTLAVPLWIPIDYLTLNDGHFPSMAIARGLLAGTLAALWLASLLRPRPWRVSALLWLTLAAPSGFYVAALLILQGGVSEAPLAGYSAMPFIMIVLTGLFPLTVSNSLAIMAMVLAAFAGLEADLGTLGSAETLNNLWILTLLCGVTLWVQSGQLLMLLKLYRESTQDPLTGLINRRVLMSRLAAEIEENQASGRPFSILMCDLDRFKRINDGHGHLMGDQVLKATAQILTRELRQSDIIARFGGEEFMALLPGLNGVECTRVAERLRGAIEAAVIHTPDRVQVPVTTSIGVTEYHPGERIEETLRRTDELLYEAKEGGRNRVVCHD